MVSPLLLLQVFQRRRGSTESSAGFGDRDPETGQSPHAPNPNGQPPSFLDRLTHRKRIHDQDIPLQAENERDFAPGGTDDTIVADADAPAVDSDSDESINGDVPQPTYGGRQSQVSTPRVAASPGEAVVEITEDKLEELIEKPRRRRLGLSTFSTLTSTSLSARPQQDLGTMRNVLRRIRYFVFQSDPDRVDDREFIPNYRYLPILSGVLSPLAILLEIPGLTEHWYVRTEGKKQVEVRQNPAIIDVAMAVSMACALFANIALIVRFLERRVKLMTYTCMAWLILHDIINVVTVTTFGVIHRFDDGFTYGEAFWMCVCSTIFSVIVTVTLAFDLITTPDFAKSGSGLTKKQRSLVIVVMILICYIALGSLVFSIIMDLTFQDGLYFTVVTIETIGFGDITPNNTASTIFCIIYATIGIVNVGLVVTTTRETVIEAFENAYRKRSAEVARRRQENKVLKAQQRARRIAIEQELQEAGLPLYVREDVPRTRSNTTGGGRGGGGVGLMVHNHVHSKLVLNEKGLDEYKRRKAEEREKAMRDPQTDTHPEEVADKHLDPDAKMGRAMAAANELRTELVLGAEDGSHLGETYVEFKRRIEREERKEFFTKLVVAWTFFLTFWLVGAGIFMAAEKEWGFGTSLYFCWMSFSTIGYGEITPTSPAGRAIFVVWALLGVAAMTILIAVLSEAYSSRYKSALTHGPFQKVLKNFEGKQKPHEEEAVSAAPSPAASIAESIHEAEQDVFGQDDTDLPPSDLAKRILDSTRMEIDSLPLDVIRHAKNFIEHVRYFSSHPNYPQEAPPEALSQLLDEIAESERMDERMKQEMLGDDDARKALFFLSYERAFKKLIDTAEKAVELIAIKDAQWEHLIRILKEHEERDALRSPGIISSRGRSPKSPGFRLSVPGPSQSLYKRSRSRSEAPPRSRSNTIPPPGSFSVDSNHAN